MKKLFPFILVLTGCLLIPIPSFALRKLGQTGLKFLDIGVGARPAAMGEAFTLVGDDANAIFHNPAGIAKSKSKFNILFHRNYWIAGISYDAVGLVVNGGIWGNFGLSLLSADYPTSIGTRVAETEQGYEETGSIEANAFSMGLSYARSLTDLFTVGGKIKYVRQELGSNLIPILEAGEVVDTEMRENSVSGLAYDIGTIFYPGLKSFRVGMSITNFSAEFKYEEETFQLPLIFKLGIAMDILDLWGEHPDGSFVLDIEAVHPRDYTQRIHIGGEYWFKDIMALRIGYKFNYDEESISAGLGFKVSGIRIDYAYSDLGIFEMVNRVSVGFDF